MPKGKKSSLGNGLINKAKHIGRYVTSNSDLHGYGKDIHQFNKHTTEDGASRRTLASVLDTNDLEEFMDIAELSSRDFTAESARAVVVTKDVVATDAMGALSPDDLIEVVREYIGRLVVPRRPPWTRTMTAEALDAQEREAFLEWRRGLAQVEEDPRVAVTPFEKNLEVWRQLWRVIERSDVIFQVVDARDPLLYRCVDLERYVAEVSAVRNVPGGCGLILNKADLLPRDVRKSWAEFFRKRGVPVLWFSARRATEEADMEPEELEERRRSATTDNEPDATRVLTRDELLDRLETATELARRARDAMAEAEDVTDAESMAADKPITVGLIGFPNVGKSSTINALLGAKKVAVAATPGKTKHFQTLRLTHRLTLCDCPGLVFPTFARSKSEMVVAGVIPVDRLTDVTAPVGEVCKRVPRGQLESVYGISLPAPPAHDLAANGGIVRPATARELLTTFAKKRGWLLGNGGYADETRAGRRVLKDYCDGKLVTCTLPPPPESVAHLGELAELFTPSALIPLWAPHTNPHDETGRLTEVSEDSAAAAAAAAASTSSMVDAAGAALGGMALELADNEGGAAPGAELLFSEQRRHAEKQKAASAMHKFGHKKAARSKKGRGRDDPYASSSSAWAAAAVKPAVPRGVGGGVL